MTLFNEVCHLPGPTTADRHCIAWNGSFTFLATNSDETAAKIVLYEEGVGRRINRDPGWEDGRYILVRTHYESDSGRAFETAARNSGFPHAWVLRRFVDGEAVSVDHQDRLGVIDEHFYYYLLQPDEPTRPLAEFLAFCTAL
jgi:hypothetical protein